MKPKNIQPFEQHFEKFVVGAAAVFLLVVFYIYWVTPPTVEVGGETAGPAEVDHVVLEKAHELRAELRQAQPATKVAKLEVPPISPTYKRHLNEPLPEDLLRGDYIAGIGGTILLTEPSVGIGVATTEGGEGGVQGIPPVHVPQVPSPTIVAVGSEVATIVSQVVENPRDGAQWLQVLGGAQDAAQAPYDVHWTTIVGRFDMATMRQQLMAEGIGNERSLPTEWWQGSFVILDVVLQRQRLMPNGTWGEPVMVRPMPGQLNLRGVMDDPNSSQAGRIWQVANARQASIVLPQLPPLKGVTRAQIMLVGEQRQIEQAPKLEPVSDYAKDLREQIESLMKIRKQLLKQQRKRQMLRQRRQRRMGDYYNGGQGSGQTTLQRRLKENQKRITTLRQRLQRERRRVLGEQAGTMPGAMPMMPSMQMPSGGMGYGPGYGRMYGPGAGYGGAAYGRGYRMGGAYGGGYGGAYGGYGRGYRGGAYGGGAYAPRYGGARGYGGAYAPRSGYYAPGGRRMNLGQLLAKETLKLRAYDFTAASGETYRYRMKVRIFNPLFHQKQLPQQQYEKYYDQFTLSSDWSEWSEPVTIAKERYFFVVGSSSDPDNPGMGWARVEVWRFYNGAWRQGEFRIHPGDPISGTMTVTIQEQTIQMPFHTGAVAVDLDFNYVSARGGIGSQTTRLLYMDEGELKQRIQSEDEQSEKREKLQNSGEMVAYNP